MSYAGEEAVVCFAAMKSGWSGDNHFFERDYHGDLRLDDGHAFCRACEKWIPVSTSDR